MLRDTIPRVFGKDQLEAMSRGGMGGVKWGSKTAKKALQIRFSCGSSEYKDLLEKQLPLPSERRIQRPLREIGFSAGNLGRSISLSKVEGLRHAEGRAPMLSNFGRNVSYM